MDTEVHKVFCFKCGELRGLHGPCRHCGAVRRRRGNWRKPKSKAKQRHQPPAKPVRPIPRNREQYREYLKSEHWRHRRAKAMRAAGHRCQHCGAMVGLNVHHRNYDHLYAEEPEDLVVACRDCHERYHRVGVWDADAAAHLLACAGQDPQPNH
jgi:hypothetical protein